MIFQEYTLSLAAGQRRRVAIRSSFFKLVSNSASARLKIAFGDEDLSDIRPGTSVRLPDGQVFNWIDFYNPSGVTMVIAYQLSNGVITDDVLLAETEIPVSTKSNAMESNCFVISTASTYQAVTPAGTMEVILQNNGAYNIWIGDAAIDVATKKGYKLEPGATFILDTSADIYARAEGGSSDLSIVWTKRL